MTTVPDFDPAKVTHGQYIDAVTDVFANLREKLDIIERAAKDVAPRTANAWDDKPAYSDAAVTAIRDLQRLTEHSTGRLLGPATDADYAARAATAGGHDG